MEELRRRTLLALLTAPVFAALIQACGSDARTASTDDVDDAVAPSRISSDVQRVPTQPNQAPLAVGAVNGFGTDLYRQLARADPQANLVLSPVSIAIALATAAAGARGDTLAEMLTTLEVEDRETFHRSMNALIAQLEAIHRDDVLLTIANSMWAQTGRKFEQPFLDLLAAEYDAALNAVDFIEDPDGARDAISRWVSDATGARIPRLLDDDAVSPDTGLVLVDAVRLLATWESPFDTNLTADASFTTAAGDTIDVPAMRQSGTLDYATGDGWQAVQLPYANSTLALLIFLPEPDFLTLFEEIFLVSDATSFLEPHQVQVQLPRFDVDASSSLEGHLIAMGMQAAFSNDADFSAITVDEQLKIDAVVHQASITVTEAGTEAAAATAVVMTPVSAPIDPPIDFVVDRPFVFALRDRATETIVFLGRVTDPRG